MHVIQTKPRKKPQHPVETRHFRINWQERTWLPVSVFWKTWRSAHFLGTTEDDRQVRGKGSLVDYWALNEWVVLTSHPRQGGYAHLLSVWPRRWWERRWRRQCHQQVEHEA